MIIVKTLAEILNISDPTVRDLVRQRIEDLGGEAFESAALGYFVVIEAADTIEAIHAQVGFNILHNRFTGVRYDRPSFTPSFEFIEGFSSLYDLVFVLDDSGIGIEVFVPKEEGIDADLIAMCRMFAYQAPPEDFP